MAKQKQHSKELDDLVEGLDFADAPDPADKLLTAETAAAEEEAETKPKKQDPRKKTGPCPRNPNHMATRVYKTSELISYCVCDDCGTTWKMPRKPARSQEDAG